MTSAWNRPIYYKYINRAISTNSKENERTQQHFHTADRIKKTLIKSMKMNTRYLTALY
jgi:hypothetical protein